MRAFFVICMVWAAACEGQHERSVHEQLGNSPGGFVVVSSDDGDDHCAGTSCGGLYPALLREAVTRSRSGGSGIIAIGVNSGSALSALNGWNATANGGPNATIVHARTAAQIAGVDFSAFAAIYVPSGNSDTGGGITAIQRQALTARQADIAEFVLQQGGSFIALTQGGLQSNWGFLPVPLTVADASFSQVAVTPSLQAIAPAATSQNVSHCCFHNVFTGPSGFAGLGVLATNNAPGSGYGSPAILAGSLGGGGDCSLEDSAVAIRDAILAEVEATGTASVDCEEYNVLFAAVAEKTGVPAKILKAYAFGEGLAEYYDDQCPRHFLEPLRAKDIDDTPDLEICTRYVGDQFWPILGLCPGCSQAPKPEDVELIHVALGVDNGSRGVGIMQITYDLPNIVAPVARVGRNTQMDDACQFVDDPTFPPFATQSYAVMNLTGSVSIKGGAYDRHLCDLGPLEFRDSCLNFDDCQTQGTYPICNNGNLTPVDQVRSIKDPLYNILLGAQLTLYKSFWQSANVPRQCVAGTPQTCLADYFDETTWLDYGRILVAGPALQAASEEDWLAYVGQVKGSYADCKGKGTGWLACQMDHIRGLFTMPFVATDAAPICNP